MENNLNTRRKELKAKRDELEELKKLYESRSKVLVVAFIIIAIFGGLLFSC